MTSSPDPGEAARFHEGGKAVSDRAEIQQRLDEIEESLAYLRGELGPSSSGETGDYGDEALSLEERDEQASQIELLEAERDRLKARLGKA